MPRTTRGTSPTGACRRYPTLRDTDISHIINKHTYTYIRIHNRVCTPAIMSSQASNITIRQGASYISSNNDLYGKATSPRFWTNYEHGVLSSRIMGNGLDSARHALCRCWIVNILTPPDRSPTCPETSLLFGCLETLIQCHPNPRRPKFLENTHQGLAWRC